MTGFKEVADRVWVARREWFALNVSLVGGAEGLVVVDTTASGREARAVIEDIRRLGIGPVTAVVNTHEHFDHTFGNREFRLAYDRPDAPLVRHAHEVAAANTVTAGERIKAQYAAEDDDPHAEEVIETPIEAATVTFSSVRVLDLGDRQLELAHPGRGHTAGDIVVRIPDADVVLAGDLVEESGPPGFGPDCFPREWPGALDVVLGLTGGASVVVPGHGAIVDRAFVEDQRNSIAILAQTVQNLAASGVPVDEMLAAGEWPFPTDGLETAVGRAFAQLPPGSRSLPLA